MNAQFSEFTYGFSLVSELAKTLACTAVPIFPSLIKEGKMGGGYDAKLLSEKGTILNLQFKLSDCMIAPNAREYRRAGHSLSLPYYRFGITSQSISAQHSLLLELEDIQPLTFYSAPTFHLNDEINTHWSSHSVSRESLYVKPSSIGELPDSYHHSVCFDASAVDKKRAYLFSDPKTIEILPFDSFSESISAEVIQTKEPLEISIRRAREQYRFAIGNAQRREQARFLDDGIDHVDKNVPRIPYTSREPYFLDPSDPLDRSLSRLDKILTPPADGEELLLQTAQVATGIFGTQAIAVVKKPT